ncbi:MAG TPA: hypothetical protein VFB66_05440 [Tepidisphaeraceae bacterium]|nr:hypothetical protein [Tepidisphaeraceae bacterium]
MGCDIHLFVETREPGGKWVLASVLRECSFCSGTGVTPEGYREPGKPCWFCRHIPGKVSGFGDRSYDTFAILANVRNGHGFAGIETGGGFISIDDPRGLPGDMSAELKSLCDDYDDDRWEELDAKYGAGSLGDHSFSWLTLAELLAYNWRQVATKTGVVSLEQFRKWDASGGGWPDGWCGSISGPGITMVSNAEMRGLIAGGRKEPEEPYNPRAKRHYTSVRWTDTYARCARSFHDKFIPALVALGKPAGDVRIVFGFDS